jgi:hypothetical protein
MNVSKLLQKIWGSRVFYHIQMGYNVHDVSRKVITQSIIKLKNVKF